MSLGQKNFLSTKIWVFFIPFPSFIYSYRIYHHHHLVWYSKNHSLHMAHHGLRSFLPDPVRPEKLSAILQHGLNLFTVERFDADVVVAVVVVVVIYQWQLRVLRYLHKHDINLDWRREWFIHRRCGHVHKFPTRRLRRNRKIRPDRIVYHATMMYESCRSLIHLLGGGEAICVRDGVID